MREASWTCKPQHCTLRQQHTVPANNTAVQPRLLLPGDYKANTQPTQVLQSNKANSSACHRPQQLSEIFMPLSACHAWTDVAAGSSWTVTQLKGAGVRWMSGVDLTTVCSVHLEAHGRHVHTSYVLRSQCGLQVHTALLSCTGPVFTSGTLAVRTTDPSSLSFVWVTVSSDT